MRKFYCALAVGFAFLALPTGGRTEVPSTMNAQGRLTDASGTPLPPGFKIFTFNIYDDSTAGSLLWGPEMQTIPSDASGLWNARVGRLLPLTSAVFKPTDTWLEIEADDGVNPPVILPRVRLATVPYAFKSAEADHSSQASQAVNADTSIYADTAGYTLLSAPDNDWVVTSDFISTMDYKGVAKGNAGNIHHGDSGVTAVNLGRQCTTGMAGMDVRYPTIGGGVVNTATADFTTIAGGWNNDATSSYCTITGGQGNLASAVAAFVGGGWNNQAEGDYASVGGGQGNEAQGNFSVVAGGWLNFATVHGGAVLGGSSNLASGQLASVVGGSVNRATADFATVGGGSSNFATGEYSSITGGYRNRAAGTYSLAAGNAAKAIHSGAIVLSANSGTTSGDTVWSTNSEQLILRADGAIYLSAGSGGASIPLFQYLSAWNGAYLSTFGAWTNASDANKKENFTAIDRGDLLNRIDRLKVTRWNYKGDPNTHIGPTAQDFHAAFGVGQDSVSICTIDPGGIALAAIQELHRQNKEQEARIAELELLVEALLSKEE